MPVKKALLNLAKTARKQLNARASKSDDRALQGAATAAMILPHLKWIIIVSLIVVILVIVGSAANGVQTGLKSLTQSLANCDPVPSDSEIKKYFTDNGAPLENPLERGESSNGCERPQGEGYNGLAYPPTSGYISSYFNKERGGPSPGRHRGMDIADACGSPIYAFAGGEVTKVVLGTEARSGNGSYAYPMGEIIIKHSENFSTRILHTKGSTTKVAVGDIVSAGQEIATQWSNGPSTGCHLHIEAHIDGVPTDMNILLKACGFIYSESPGQMFTAFPEEPVACGAGGEAGMGAEGIKGYAKSQMVAINGVSESDVSSEFTCLNNLWNRESNWRPTAQNNRFAPYDPPAPEYQAYGIAQAAPGAKMANEGSDWKTNPQTQVRWGLKYIKGRYGTPCGAWAHSESYNWY